jgi:hypothetical protein
MEFTFLDRLEALTRQLVHSHTRKSAGKRIWGYVPADSANQRE